MRRVKNLGVVLALVFVLSVFGGAVDNLPRLEIEYPPFPALQFRPNYIPRTNRDVITVKGSTDVDSRVWVQGKEVEVLEDGSFAVEVALEEGMNTIRVKAQKIGYLETLTIERYIIKDTKGPELEIYEPETEVFVSAHEIKISGKTHPRNRLLVDGMPVEMEEDGSFSLLYPLEEGENFISVVALDEILPNMTMKVLKVVADTVKPTIEIISPHEKYIAKEDYIVIYGRTKPFATVSIEDTDFEVIADQVGQFEIEVPLKEGRNYFDFLAIDRAGNTATEYVRIVKDTTPPMILDFQPSGFVAFMPGDLIDISFRSNEFRCTGSFMIGDKGPFPITEQTTGRYRGVYRIQADDITDLAPITITLTDEANNTVESNMAHLTVYDPSQPLVANLNPSDGQAVIRSGPSSDYDRICHIGKGPRVEITGRIGDYYRISPAKTFSAWTHKDNLEFLPKGSAPGKALITNIVVSENGPDYVNISFSISDNVFYTITPLAHEPALLVTFYNTTGGVYHIAWKENTDYVKLITPIQLTDDILQYRIDLKGKLIYGYEDNLQGNTLNLRLKSRFSPQLAGKTITIDPGHGGGDSGAVGPTGLREADINLKTALVLKELLEEEGVKVYMTRDDKGQYAPGLYDRVDFAEKHRTDMFVSIHNNAAGNRSAKGSEAYYFTPYSHELSKLTMKYMTEHQGSDYRFFAHRSFAVIRQWTMPAILTEGDFVSNYDIEKWQRTDDFINKNAESIFMAIKEFVETFGFED